ncbi:MAG: scramblase [Flavobacteriaceae bacterium]|nr:scramblase [Flavobacteriaceae bacterium]
MTMAFFDANSFFIDEKVNFFQFENSYKIFNEQGVQIGNVKQKLTAGQKFLRLLLNKAMLPFKLEIKDNSDKVLATVSRGWTFFMSKINIADSYGNNIGSIQQKFKLFKPKFTILNELNLPIAEINGDWKAWDFKITDTNQSEIGTISKKWAGAVQEIFTSADKYNVSIKGGFKDEKTRIAIISGAITIDMVLKESK